MKSHGCTTLNIAELVASCRCLGVSVEESSHWCSVLWEVWVVETLLPFLVEVHDVVSLWGEESSQLLISENLIKYPYLIHGWFGTLVSNTSSCHQGEEGEVQLPESTLGEHHEAESSVAHEASGPPIVGSVQVVRDLVQVVASTHAPLPVVVLEEIVAPRKLAWVTLGFSSLWTISSMERVNIVEVDTVDTLRWLETHIVVAWVVVLPECSYLREEQWAGIPT